MDDSRIPVQTGHEMKPPRKPRRGFGLKIIAAFVAGILFLSAVTGVGPLGDWIQNWRGNLYAEQTTGQYDGTPAQRGDLREADEEERPSLDEEKPTRESLVAGESGDSAPLHRHFDIASASTRDDRADQRPLTTIEIAEKGKAAVVAIMTMSEIQIGFGMTDLAEAAGSGFIISEDGYIVTNRHVVANSQSISVQLDNGDFYDARLVGMDRRNDIAVLKIEGENLPTVTLGSSDDLVVGELAVAIGNPTGKLSNTVTVGVISALSRDLTIEGETMNVLQTDAAINPGNSGGALFNSYGEVVGINTAKASGGGLMGTPLEGLGFAIPIDRAKPLIEELIEKGYISGRPWMGIALRDISAEQAAFYNLGFYDGILITLVAEGSPAERAGLRAYDIVIEYDGQGELTTEKMKEINASKAPGDVVEMVVVRNGREYDASITLGEEQPE